MLEHCDYAECKIDQTLFPRIGVGFLEISEGEILLFKNTDLISPRENGTITKIEQNLEFLKDNKPHITHTIMENIERHKKNSVAEIILSAILGICVQPNQAWCWVENKEIIAWIEKELSRTYSDERISEELTYLSGQGFVQFLVHQGVKHVSFKIKINSLFKPEYFSSCQKAS